MLNASLSLTDQALKDSFVEGSLVIDCLEIKLNRNGPGEPSSFASAGFLLASPEQGIEGRFVIARSSHQPYDMFASMREQSELRSGQLIPPSRYFALEARDIAGNLWINPSATVAIEHRLDAFIVKVSCSWLRCESTLESSASATHMVFMDELSFPDNVIHSQRVLERGKKQWKLSSNSSAGEAAGMLVTYDARVDRPGPSYGELFAANQSKTALPDNFDDRLVEAIRFCTATVTEPVMRETVHNGKRVLELTSHRPANKGMLEPPLQPRGNDADFYGLLERYFFYAAANAAGRDFAPLSAKVGGLFALKGVNLDTIALLVSVAVESVLGEKSFQKLGTPSVTVLEQLKQMIKHIRAAAQVEPNFVKRVCDVLGGIKSSRAKDKLHALVLASAIDEADRKAWNDTRNKAAHGSFEIDPAKFQELIDVVFRLSALVYKLVFLQIGYKGKFTDYGEHDWPLRDFAADLTSISSGSVAATSSPVAAKSTVEPRELKDTSL
ncbi:MAG: hypothetical protein BGO63_10250 [Candidatus Accumulibacter sp. 66-26]|nr:hypothetical protein [Accumulibacter sp.]OJW47495.1 MAG: hypothetical protein BGO63_10250 [Candidatus Accumulibacter sp. 66-26]